MSLFNAISISASGLTAERMRLDVIAENLANANTTRGVDGQPYRRKSVVLQEIPLDFAAALARASTRGRNRYGSPGGVEIAAIVSDPTPGRRVYDPSHPDADEDGYVIYPNVNPVTEMVDLITASRSYEANANAMNTAKTMFQKTLELLR